VAENIAESKCSLGKGQSVDNRRQLVAHFTDFSRPFLPSPGFDLSFTFVSTSLLQSHSRDKMYVDNCRFTTAKRRQASPNFDNSTGSYLSKNMYFPQLTIYFHDYILPQASICYTISQPSVHNRFCFELD